MGYTMTYSLRRRDGEGVVIAGLTWVTTRKLCSEKVHLDFVAPRCVSIFRAETFNPDHATPPLSIGAIHALLTHAMGFGVASLPIDNESLIAAGYLESCDGVFSLTETGDSLVSVFQQLTVRKVD